MQDLQREVSERASHTLQATTVFLCATSPTRDQRTRPSVLGPKLIWNAYYRRIPMNCWPARIVLQIWEAVGPKPELDNARRNLRARSLDAL